MIYFLQVCLSFLSFFKVLAGICYITLMPVILYWRLPSVLAQEGVLSEGPLSRQEAAGTVPVHGVQTRPAAQD